jgi:hypothetical protein
MELEVNSAEIYRRAAQCYRLAEGAVPYSVARDLARLGRELQREAMRLDAGDRHRPVVRRPLTGAAQLSR